MLDQNLLGIKDADGEFASTLDGTTIRGSYNTMQFVLRLRDDIRKALELEEDSHERNQAYSTFLHETIHWWQHVGSTFGLIYSLSFPAVATNSAIELKKLVELGYSNKSLIKFDQAYYAKHGKADIPELNSILNTYFDTAFAKSFALDNTSMLQFREDKRFFISIGHCYLILWSNSTDVLKPFDPEKKIFPNVDDWVKEFKALEEADALGFGVDGDIAITQLGIKAIYEGQAIFSQMQFLAISLDEKLSLKDCEDNGMLSGIYGQAFDLFLEGTGLTRPYSIIDPVIGLFILICDIAINPGDGFPFQPTNYERFIADNDPGLRFYRLCREIAKAPDEYGRKIVEYTSEEYFDISNKLCTAVGFRAPQEILELVKTWFKEPEIERLLKEESDHSYKNENLPIRLFFSKFLRFQEDKLLHPDFFCWPGYNLTGKHKSLDIPDLEILFDRHRALFTDHEDGEIKAVILRHIDEEQTLNTFNSFYQYNIMYDLVLKWIDEEGQFKYDYKWLSNKKDEDLLPHIKRGFEKQFGISPDDLKIV